HGCAAAGCRGKRLIEILDDVIDVLDADAEPDHLGADASFALLFRRHLAVGRRSRMTGKRLGIAHVNQTFDEVERVVTFDAGVKTSTNAERQERASPASEIFLRKPVIWAVRKPDVVDPLDPRIAAKKLGDAFGVFHVTLYTQ